MMTKHKDIIEPGSRKLGLSARETELLDALHTALTVIVDDKARALKPVAIAKAKAVIERTNKGMV